MSSNGTTIARSSRREIGRLSPIGGSLAVGLASMSLIGEASAAELASMRLTGASCGPRIDVDEPPEGDSAAPRILLERQEAVSRRRLRAAGRRRQEFDGRIRDQRPDPPSIDRLKPWGPHDHRSSSGRFRSAGRSSET